jgi:hypothetical protein
MKTLAALLMGGWLAAGVAAQSPAPAAAPATISKSLAKRLARQFPGWQLAALESSCQAQAGNSPSLVSGDFNSDTLPDLAVQIQATAPGVALVVAFTGLDDARIVQIDTRAGAAAPRILSVARKGSKFTSAAGADDYFPHATLVAMTCAGDRTAYLWNGATFTAVPLKAPAR